MYKLLILPLAKQDIREAATWYNEQQPDLGKRFIKFIRSKVKRISENPQLYPVRYHAVRTAVVDVFPFTIHFVVNESDRTILITAVLHTSQSPEKWFERQQ
ncbi:type II toxin-antitoxin system RelE/ParE family toxin [Dyadobacter fanqingshengii]|uniref:Type II toxin-antitoxin system RelE/ParE family toxin n=1 Tax=Dyadobacter fanqingshengii TaxID=2906443 RepID=A0A9X1PFC8_9BACT|nr:type II toxin-antitoxin system RelE/ParE family toxin [Dyadobacter fanqingshengii]MCF0042222.1 type II toxin-antitoxin system RelE/ParE family toxin [Dyadobacter fanqingshengii]USJ35247.1 type II toxin-antitoxin system RelE/ParE family toxin [Dyadobacter fanqingshengii]